MQKLFWLVVLAICFGIAYTIYSNFWVSFDRPHFLVRDTAASAIASSARFQHLTKVAFEVGEAAVGAGCDNFEINPAKRDAINGLIKAGLIKFKPYGNQSPPFTPPRGATEQMSDPFASEFGTASTSWLIDTFTYPCPKQVVTSSETGVYEVSVGQPMVIVNGILKQGNEAHIDFEWGFNQLNDVGKSLSPLAVRYGETSRFQSHTFHGTAHMMKYDDGWRIVDLELPGWMDNEGWPDPDFNWGAFDEDENVYNELR
jgi:hypothetical protein